MARRSLQQKFSEIKARTDPGRRFIDLAARLAVFDRIDGVVKQVDESRIYGGRWDIWSQGYDASEEPTDVVEIPVTKWQWEEVIQPVVETVNVEECVSAGRGSGKTVAGVIAVGVVGLETPFGHGHLVAPTHDLAQLMWDRFLDTLPFAQFLRAGSAGEQRQKRRLVYLDGFTMRFGSADRPRSLRAGDADILLLDERQDIRQRAVDIGTFQLRKKAGYRKIQIGTPELGSDFDEEWQRYEQQVTEGNVSYHLASGTSYTNCFTNHQIFENARDTMDADLYAQEVLGEWRSLKPRAFFPFQEAIHVRDVDKPKQALLELYGSYAGIGDDITEQVTRERYGVAKPYIIGVDMRILPMVAVVYRLFRTPKRVAPLAWAVAEVVLERDADAREMAGELVRRRFGNAVVFPDCRGRSSVGGESGWRMLRERKGFKLIARPENPPGVERRSSTNGMLLSESKQVRLLFDPACEHQIRARKTQGVGPDQAPIYKCVEDHHTAAGDYPLHAMWPVAQLRAQVRYAR